MKKLIIVLLFNILFATFNYKLNLIKISDYVQVFRKIQNNHFDVNFSLYANYFDQINFLITRKAHYDNNYNLGKYKFLKINQQIQKTLYWCAPTTASMLLENYGIITKQEKLASLMEAKLPFGTHNQKAIDVINDQFNLHNQSKRYKKMSLGHDGNYLNAVYLFKQNYIKSIDQNYPVYLTLDLSVISDTRTAEHNVLGIGYVLNANNDDIVYIIFLDPSPTPYNKNYGSLRIISLDNFLNSIRSASEPDYAY